MKKLMVVWVLAGSVAVSVASGMLACGPESAVMEAKAECAPTLPAAKLMKAKCEKIVTPVGSIETYVYAQWDFPDVPAADLVHRVRALKALTSPMIWEVGIDKNANLQFTDGIAVYVCGVYGQVDEEMEVTISYLGP